MIALSNILYPTDFSDVSLNAMKYAKAFARQFDATLHCLHIVDEAYNYWLSLGPDGVPMGPDPEEITASANQKLKEFDAEHLADVGKRVVTVLRGHPFVEIIQYARRESIDLIVLGTHGRGAIAHALVGSVAEKVVRKAPCPVLTCRPKEHEFVMP
jgi:nucleotide-binding universal stress UspA family protein